MTNKKTKIILTSINKKILHFYKFFLIKVLTKFNISYKLMAMPIIKNRITLLKSPHVYKKAWEHFELNKYKLVFYIDNKNLSNNLKFLLLKNRIKNINFKIKIQI